MNKLKTLTALIAFTMLFFACGSELQNDAPTHEDWTKRTMEGPGLDSLDLGKSYLSIYSQIYSSTVNKAYNLTAMVSIRNTSEMDTLYILKADYYDTHGKLIEKYVDKTIFLAPMETIEIIINEKDIAGGTGSNFLFNWKIQNNSSTPLFEAVMNSTLGQQGLSFTTQAVRTK